MHARRRFLWRYREAQDFAERALAVFETAGPRRTIWYRAATKNRVKTGASRGNRDPICRQFRQLCTFVTARYNVTFARRYKVDSGWHRDERRGQKTERVRVADWQNPVSKASLPVSLE